MVDYSKTKIYYIPFGDERYYGHTTQSLSKRKVGHINDFKKETTRKLYKYMRENGYTADDIELYLVEVFSCENVEQARARERYWIETLNAKLNCNMPITTKEEKDKQKQDWYENNKEEILEKAKEHYEENKEQKKYILLRSLNILKIILGEKLL